MICVPRSLCPRIFLSAGMLRALIQSTDATVETQTENWAH